MLLIMLGLGFVSGVLGGLLGIGGGTIIVPGLVFFFGFNQHKAHGTSLLIALALAGSGVLTYFAQGNVQFLIALEIAGGGVVGAIFGAKTANAVKGKVLRQIFSVFLLLVGIRMVLACCQIANGASFSTPAFLNEPIVGTLVVIGIGVLTGFMSALLGIGGGMVMVPALALLLGLPQKTAHGTSLAAMMPTAFTGLLMHTKAGNVDYRLGKWVCLGAIVGAFLGAFLAISVGGNTLRIIFGVFLLLMAGLMMLKKR